MTGAAFAYTATDGRGRKRRGRIEAADAQAASRALRGRGLTPLTVRPAESLLRREISLPGFGARLSQRDLAVLARQFATMNAAGVSLLRTLAVLEEQAAAAPLKQAVAAARADVEAGVALSDALARHDALFPPMMVAMIRAGEAGGFLDAALERIATILEKDAALRAKTKSALTYPIIVLGFTGLLIAGVLVFIVPVFERMFAQFGGELPLPTRILVSVSHSLVWWAPPLAAAAAAGTVLFRRRLRADPALRLRVDRLKLRVPVFGPLLTKTAVSRFARNLSALLGAGVPMMRALEVVGGTTGNAVVAAAADDIRSAVRDGRPMSAPLAEHAVFPPMVGHMLQVGEESGRIGPMLDKVADFYDREVDGAAESLTTAIEPVMVLVMGGVVGSMVVCLYLPMFTIYQHIQGTQ
ncbi:type II secretion system F family protein [Spirillospora sp. CA-253888]